MESIQSKCSEQRHYTFVCLFTVVPGSSIHVGDWWRTNTHRRRTHTLTHTTHTRIHAHDSVWPSSCAVFVVLYFAIHFGCERMTFYHSAQVQHTTISIHNFVLVPFNRFVCAKAKSRTRINGKLWIDKKNSENSLKWTAKMWVSPIILFPSKNQCKHISSKQLKCFFFPPIFCQFCPQKYRNVAAVNSVNSLANVRRHGGELRVITPCSIYILS